MKKLMIAMTAAAAGALVAQAETGTISGTSFEALTAGQTLGVHAGDVGGEGDTVFWASEANEVGIISNYTGEASVSMPIASRPSEYASTVNSKYLAVDTEKKLFRNISVSNGEAQPVDIGEGLYVDTLVQFTATETAPTTDAADKLIVWLQAIDADETADPVQPGSTNLVVTAGYLSNSGNTSVASNYVCSATVEPNSWHRLTIKAINDVSKDNQKVPAFVVFIDGEALTCAGDKGVSASAVGSDSISEIAARWNTSGALFPSLVTTGDAKQTLTALAVEGTGAIDDIVFTTAAPTFAQDVIAEKFKLVINPGEYDATDPCYGIAAISYAVDGGSAVTVSEDASSESEVIVGASSVVVYAQVYSDCKLVDANAVKGAAIKIGEGDDAVDGFLWTITTNVSTIGKDGTVTVNVTVAKDDGSAKTQLANSMITLDATTAVYAEGMTFPVYAVATGSGTLVINQDYTAAWDPAEITGPGTYTLTVTAAKDSDYSGTATATFVVTEAQAEGKAKVGETEYESGDAFVAAATSGTQNTLPTGWKVEGNVVKDAKGDTFATFPSYYNVTLADGVLTLELNANAKTTVAIDTTAKTPMAVDAEAGVTLAVTVTNEKLYYALASSATLAGTYEAPAAEKFVKGNGGNLSLNAAKTGATRFYKILVTDVVPAK